MYARSPFRRYRKSETSSFVTETDWRESQIDMVAGTDFPQDLTPYSLVIHCGACMFNRKYVLSRIERAREQHIPMTNYGVAIAFLNGILDQIKY